MANVPVVIPYAMTQLATAVVLDGTITTAQTIFTVPNGEKVIPMWIVFRDGSSTNGAAGTVSLGTTASATAYLNTSTVLASFLTTTGPVVLPLYGSTVPTAVAYIPALSVLTIKFPTVLTTTGTIKVDVLGYVTAI